MRTLRFKLAIAVAVVSALTVGAIAMATGDRSIDEDLTGYEEVPALSTPGVGEFHAFINKSAQEIRYRLTFSRLESAATQSHIHFENATNNGPIVVFLCTNLGNGPAGTQGCPANGGTITGTIRPADVGAGAAAQGLAAGEFDEFVRALQSGATYVNVHSADRPSGEIRAQIDVDRDRGRHH
ncbi:MAG TPA: CHRD domain-containing protein [Thermoleophilaceae bacterium]